jgi:hypothetical protein
MEMTVTDNRGINILGALVLRMSGKSPTDKKYETRQIVYVSDNITTSFLSKQACIALGVIPPTFPTIGDMDDDSSAVHSSATQPPTSTDTHCACPRRQAPPPRPTTLPFAPTVNNRDKLEKWLLDY